MDLVFGIIGKQETEKRKIFGGERTAYFLIDCSMSMRGLRIEKINAAVPAIIKMLVEAKEATHIAVLSFSKGSAWMHKDVRKIEEFKWKDCKVDSITNLGLAFGALSKMLNRVIIETEGHRLPPVIILICDGEPTDDWEEQLGFLMDIVAFETAKKYAFVLDFGDPIDAVLQFTGNVKNSVNVSADSLFTEMKKTLLQSEEGQKGANTVLLETNSGETEQKAETAMEDSADAAVPPKNSNKYYLSFNYKETGPFTWEELLEKIYNREISPDYFIKRDGCEWAKLDFYPELNKLYTEGFLL
jgi:uncharacterized protein YegL